MKKKNDDPSDDELKKMMDDYFIPDPKDDLYLTFKNPAVTKTPRNENPPVVTKEVSDDELMRMMENYLPQEDERSKQKNQTAIKKSDKIPAIDLHYKKVEHAKNELKFFMQKQFADSQVQKVLIITGKGLGSENYEAKLKPMVMNELQTTYAGKIKHIQTAPPDMGGSGAILVFIR